MVALEHRTYENLLLIYNSRNLMVALEHELLGQSQGIYNSRNLMVALERVFDIAYFESTTVEILWWL